MTEDNYQVHLDREWTAMGWPTESDDDPQVWIYHHMQRLLEVFADEGHSGSSAPYAVNLFKKLALFKPLGPLTGDDAEWMEVRTDVFQNKRCSHVFKENGEAYDIQGRIFREPDGACFTNRDSRTPVTFPYTPKSEYVDVPKTSEES